tara:strand:+ start:58 stop:396 length:339 start_codon:yes stop_codon:yes gene_type:complete
MTSLVTIHNSIENKGSAYAVKKYGPSLVNKAKAMKPYWNKDNKADLTRRIRDTESMHGTKGQKPSVTGQNLLKDMKTNYKARFGGGRAAAALDSGRGGLSKSLTAKKLIPNT